MVSLIRDGEWGLSGKFLIASGRFVRYTFITMENRRNENFVCESAVFGANPFGAGTLRLGLSLLLLSGGILALWG